MVLGSRFEEIWRKELDASQPLTINRVVWQLLRVTSEVDESLGRVRWSSTL